MAQQSLQQGLNESRRDFLKTGGALVVTFALGVPKAGRRSR